MTIRGPIITNPASRPSTLLQVLGSSIALLTAVVAAPFVNPDMSKAATRVRLTAPDQLHTNITRFTNPIPIVSTDRPMVWNAPRPPPPQSLPLNLNLFKNNVPFRVDWPSSFHVPDFLPSHAAQNTLPLSAVVAAAPFSKVDWSTARNNPDFLSPAQPYNLNLYGTPSGQITIFLTSGTTWTVPSDCNLVDQVDCIGGGGSGAVSGSGSSSVNGSGGGGGAWARATGITVTPSGSVTIQVGAGGAGVSSTTLTAGTIGTDTWFNGASLAASSCGAKAGGAGTTAATNGNLTGAVGGAEASCVGGVGGGTTNPGTTYARSGGAGGSATTAQGRATGGGGAAGSTGNGTTAVANAVDTTGSAGGSGDAGSGGAGSAGVTGSSPSLAGGNGTEYDATHGSGGGSGGCYFQTSPSVSGAAGLYGAGSGASLSRGGAGTSPIGGAGLIVIKYTPVAPNAIVGEAEFGRSSFPKIARTDQVPFNINLFQNPIPFAQYDWSTPRRTPNLLPAAQPNNILIYSEVPFDQTDWSKPQTLAGLPPQAQPYNINVFSEIPFPAGDFSASPRRSFSPPVQPYNTALLTGTVQNPFIPIDWSRPQTLAGLPPQAQPYNVNIFPPPVVSVPFNQTSWVPTHSVIGYPGLSDQAIWSFVIPFNQLDWSKPQRLVGSPPQAQPYNVNTFPPPDVPFLNVDWGKQQRLAGLPPQAQPYNTNLYPPPVVTAAPFLNTDWSRVFGVQYFPPAQIAAGIIDISQPFNQSDWSRPFYKAYLPPAQPYNVSVYATPPAAAPFSQTSWPLTRSVIGYPGLSDQAIWAFTIPFNQLDWSAPFRPRLSAPKVETVNVALQAPAVASPFAQYDWSTSRRVPSFIPPAQPYSVLVYSGVPFYQLDWSKPQKPPARAAQVSALNLALIVPPVAAPFSQSYWPMTMRIRATSPEPVHISISMFPAPLGVGPRKPLYLLGSSGYAVSYWPDGSGKFHSG